MKMLKYQIFFAVLFMTIGIAAVTTNLVTNGTTPIASNPDDFSVYFSNVLVNDTQDLSLVRNETSLVFTGEFSSVGTSKIISYDITNSSRNYDADINITCTQGTEYLTIDNSFDTNTSLAATSTRTGVLIVTLSKSYTGTVLTQEISCEINASAIERNTQGSGTIADPVSSFYVGREISIDEEKFNIISETEDTVSMLAQYNLGTDYRQSVTENKVSFSTSSGWEYSPGPKEIDIQKWSTNPKTYVNEYVTYLQSETKDVTLSGDLITLNELKNLGCESSEDYAYNYDLVCRYSPYSTWLINGQSWWTKSAESKDLDHPLWMFNNSGILRYQIYTAKEGIRPVIIISKETIRNLG